MTFLPSPKEHPDTVVIDVCGVDVHFLLSQRAYQMARDEGIDLSALEDVDETADAATQLGTLSTLLYVGNLPFDGEIESLQEVEDVMTPQVAERVGDVVARQFEGVEDEEAGN